MCGITGFWNFRSQWSQGELEHLATTMAQKIAYRGPDSQGTWVDAEKGLAFAHRRLSIIDLSPAGHQPMISASGRFVMTYNGEVYNAAELRKELSHIPFRGHSDTEVILEACEAWGVSTALQKFIGMFAFALYDRQERRLYLARDRLGIKPLYWGQQGQSFIFGSELKCLKTYPLWETQLDKKALTHYFRFNYIPAPYSIFQHIHKLKPGYLLTIDQSQDYTLQPFWDFEEVVTRGIESQKRTPHSPHEYVEQLHVLLKDAVKRRLLADVPLGAFLSGGVDSSTVVALMQAQSSAPVKTFSIGFYEKEFNEAEQAKAVAQHLGCDHHELYLHVDDATKVIPDLPNIYDEPFADSSQIPTYLISKLAREQVKVCLSGDGGDELMAGYNRYLFAHRRWDKIKWLPANLRGAVGYFIRSMPPGVWNQLMKALPHPWQIPQLGHKLHRASNLLAASDIREFYSLVTSLWDRPHHLVRGENDGPYPFPHPPSELDSVSYQQFLDIQTYLPDDILTKVDRASMAVSLEARVPLLDHRLIEYAWSIPTHVKLNEKTSKWPLKQVLKQYVPPSLVERPKMGFAIPVDRWLRGPLKEWASALLDPKKIQENGILNAPMIEERWQEHLSGRYNRQESLWGVLMFQSWYQKWFE